jgi:hypothetical protein
LVLARAYRTVLRDSVQNILPTDSAIEPFFFMRGFPDMEAREPMKAKFYEGELWKTELEQTLMPLLEKYDVVLVEDVEGRFNW